MAEGVAANSSLPPELRSAAAYAAHVASPAVAAESEPKPEPTASKPEAVRAEDGRFIAKPAPVVAVPAAQAEQVVVAERELPVVVPMPGAPGVAAKQEAAPSALPEWAQTLIVNQQRQLDALTQLATPKSQQPVEEAPDVESDPVGYMRWLGEQVLKGKSTAQADREAQIAEAEKRSAEAARSAEHRRRTDEYLAHIESSAAHLKAKYPALTEAHIKVIGTLFVADRDNRSFVDIGDDFVRGVLDPHAKQRISEKGLRRETPPGAVASSATSSAPVVLDRAKVDELAKTHSGDLRAFKTALRQYGVQ